ncbi:MAG: hypothetical protein ACI4WT_05085 [Oligosphaeraceae bacterium]
MERQLNRRLARAVRRRGRPGRFDWLWRSLLALLGVALFHGVFACMVLEKARRAVVPAVSDEETLRLWCMSADDGRLSPLASDFLRLNDALLDDVGQVTLLDASLEHPVRQAPSAGLTLGWGDFTRRLDEGLSASSLSLGRHGESGVLPPSLASLRHDLSLWALDVRVSVARQQLSDLSGAMGVVRAGAPSRPLAVVSRYEDSAWSAVSESELGDFGKRAAILLASCGDEGALSESSAGLSAGAPSQVVLSVVERGRQGARVQVRVSSGNAELDGLARAWALRRHGWQGHHQPLPGEAERRREIEYVFEVRPGTAAERR